jgi:hypothetical protein
MQQDNPKVVVSFLSGAGGSFITAIFGYLFDNIQLPLNVKLGHAHPNNSQYVFGPEWSISDEYFQQFIFPLLPPKPQVIKSDRVWFPIVLNRMDYSNSLIDITLRGQKSCRPTTTLVDRTHILNRELLNKWYNSVTHKTEIVSITAIDTIHEAHRRALSKNEIRQHVDISAFTSCLKNMPDITAENENRLLPFSIIIAKDVDYIWKFILRVCNDINFEITPEQEHTVKHYMSEYFACQS